MGKVSIFFCFCIEINIVSKNEFLEGFLFWKTPQVDSAKYKKTKNMSSDMRIVQRTWKVIAADMNKSGEVFYTNLFTMYPELQHTYYKNVSMKVQAIRLMHMIDTCVELLEKPAYMLLDELLKLGYRHTVLYKVQPEAYPWVWNALAATMRQVFGADFTPEVENAWMRTYGIIVDTMQKGGMQAGAVHGV